MYNYKKHLNAKALNTIRKMHEVYSDAKGCNIEDCENMDSGERGEYHIFKGLLKFGTPVLVDLYIPTINIGFLTIQMVTVFSFIIQ